MYPGERFNSITHLVGAALALIGVNVLVTLAGVEGGAVRIVSFTIYGVTLFLPTSPRPSTTACAGARRGSFERSTTMRSTSSSPAPRHPLPWWR